MSPDEFEPRPLDRVSDYEVAHPLNASASIPGSGARVEVGRILIEAWSLTKGSKTVILGAGLVNFLIGLAGNRAGEVAAVEGVSTGLATLSLLISLAGMAISYGINAGTWVYAIKRASGDPTASLADVFSRLSMLGSIFLMMLLYGVLVLVGLLFFILPGLYLALGYLFALPLMADRGTGIWQSLEISRKAIHGRWFSVLAVVVVTGVVVSGGALLTLGIGLIWLWPWATLVFAIAYRNLLGSSARV
jgi:hypothetical protein